MGKRHHRGEKIIQVEKEKDEERSWIQLKTPPEEETTRQPRSKRTRGKKKKEKMDHGAKDLQYKREYLKQEKGKSRSRERRLMGYQPGEGGEGNLKSW